MGHGFCLHLKIWQTLGTVYLCSNELEDSKIVLKKTSNILLKHLNNKNKKWNLAKIVTMPILRVTRKSKRPQVLLELPICKLKHLSVSEDYFFLNLAPKAQMIRRDKDWISCIIIFGRNKDFLTINCHFFKFKSQYDIIWQTNLITPSYLDKRSSACVESVQT